MLEKHIEQQFVKSVRTAGGIAPKLTCPGFDGMPDRLALLPGGRIAFVEVKAPVKNRVRFSLQGTDFSGVWDLRCMSLTAFRR